LEPFKVTVTGSFSADDIMNSSLLNQGLRILVSFALRVRVRSLRDFADGAVFYGRKWKRSSAKSPLVECTELVSVEIDDQDRAIITGRAKIRASYDAPVIEQSFKLRTKVATPRNGRAIKLSEPEIALVLECPKQWEKKYVAAMYALFPWLFVLQLMKYGYMHYFSLDSCVSLHFAVQHQCHFCKTRHEASAETETDLRLYPHPFSFQEG